MTAAFHAFHDVTFPVPVALGARVTTHRQTEIVTLGSGHEERNTRWRFAKRTYDAGGGVRSVPDLFAVQSFFEARMGQLYAFRFRDPLDYASSPPGVAISADDQALGTGDGINRSFALTKHIGPNAAPRAISLPVPGSVNVAVDGSATTQFTLTPSGQILFDETATPGDGQTVTAGFLFDVPARFDTDTLDMDLTAFKAGSMPTIALIEVFLKEVDDA